MNQNIQKNLTQKNNSPEFPNFSKIQQNSNLIPNPHHSPINRVSILKTEEQKEIVRTNFYDPNDSSGNKKEFSVVTEIIRRNSILSFNSKNNINNTYNKLPLNFSFNQQISEPSFNQTFQKPDLNIEIKDFNKNESKFNDKKDNYKLLIKRIASQLNVQIRPPSQGFFYFAMLKGQYPLMIINKLKKEIINHTIDLDNEIFEIYSEKYMKYMELVKKIAHLLKMNMKNKMFWENERYKQKNNNSNSNSNINNQNVQTIKITKNIKANTNQNVQNIILKNTSKANNIKINSQNKTAQNIKSTLTFQNQNNNNINNTYHNQSKNVFGTMNQKKSNFLFQAGKEYDVNKNNKDVQNKNQNNTGSHRMNIVINPFNVCKNQNQNNIDLTQKNEFINNQFKKPISSINEINNNFERNNGKAQTITLSKAKINKEISNVNGQNKTKDNIEIKDTLNIDNNYIDETEVNNDNGFFKDNIIEKNKDSKMLINTNKSNEQNNIISNTKQKINSFNIQKNYFQNNPPILRTNNVQKIILSSKKSDKKNLQIKLSALKKSDEMKIATQIKPKIFTKEAKIDFNEINIPNINSNITNDHVIFVNKFNIFLNNSGIVIESNIPLSNEEKGQKYLKMDEFWEKYINYIYINYLINKIKISLFTFIHLIEEYFIWCENNDADSAKKMKNLVIQIINKVFNGNEIKKFLEMNKLNKLDDLFAKYEVFFKYGNKNNYKNNKQVEIKIENEQGCNCELCKNEKACLLKMSEINKKVNTNVNVESILINAEYLPKKDNNSNKKLKSNNLQISFKGKGKNNVFSKSKTEKSFESEYQYLPIKKNSAKKVEKFLNIISESKNKEKSEKKINEEEEREPKKENFIDIPNNTKIEDFFKIELEKNVEKKSKSKEKSVEKENNNEKESYKSKEEKNKKEKSKKNNRKKSKPSKKSNKRKNIYLDSESDSKSGSESEENKSRDKSKRSYQYPKTKKTKGKK